MSDETLQGGEVVRGEQLGEVLRRREMNPRRSAGRRLRPGWTAAVIAGPAPENPLGLFLALTLATTHRYSVTFCLGSWSAPPAVAFAFQSSCRGSPCLSRTSQSFGPLSRSERERVILRPKRTTNFVQELIDLLDHRITE